MRCCNCGWDNPDHFRICQKCGRPLDAVLDVESCVDATSEIKICNNCGYPVTRFSDLCPNCNCDPDAKVRSYFLSVPEKSDERIRLESGKTVMLGGIQYLFEVIET